jgi:hypothetical protein
MLKEFIETLYYRTFGCETTRKSVEGKTVFIKATLKGADDACEHGIPKIINYVWISSLKAEAKKPIDSHFLNCELPTNLEILNETIGYKHVIWTDNYEVVKAQINFMGYNNVEVKDTASYMENSSLLTTYHNYHSAIFTTWSNHLNSATDKTDYINNPNIRLAVSEYRYYDLGIEIDLLKYYILQKTGGIIADLNFQFKSAPLDNDMRNNDFFHNQRAENSFFGSKPNSIFLEKTLEICNYIFETRKDVRADGHFKYGFQNPLLELCQGDYSKTTKNEDQTCFEEHYEVETQIATNIIGYDTNEYTWHHI